MFRTSWRYATLAALLGAAALPSPARAGCFPMSIPDSGYDGILDGNDGFGADAGMVCCDFLYEPSVPGTVEDVNVSIGIAQTWIGDLVIKLKSPEATIATLQSRAGANELLDDGGISGGFGSGANWAGAPILYDEQSNGPDSEDMGSGLDTDGVVCTGNSVCAHTPHSGVAPDVPLDSGFDGEDYVGIWSLCVGDSASPDAGSWESGDLSITLNRRIPCVCNGKFRGGDHVRFAPTAGPVSEGEIPTIGGPGVVMCGDADTGTVLVAWEGYTAGNDGLTFCDCPTGKLPNGTTSGYFTQCDDMELDLPWLDDFESGDTNHWTQASGG